MVTGALPLGNMPRADTDDVDRRRAEADAVVAAAAEGVVLSMPRREGLMDKVGASSNAETDNSASCATSKRAWAHKGDG